MSIFTNLRKTLKVSLALFLMTFAVNFTAKAQAPYGEQFYNYGFEEWINEGAANVEPTHWHSFKSAAGSYTSMMAQQINYSTETRPGSEGSRSARIYSREINVVFSKIIANGNMTTGRIYAGAMSATSSDNYNYTERNTDYCTPITSVPDSLTVWVCFRAGDASDEAAVKVAIHGDADFKQLGDGGYSPADKLCATANYTYTRTCASGASLVWKRLTIPFTSYPDVCTDYRYILATFTTNKEGGEGAGSDEVYVDDACLIYNPSLSLGEIAQTEYMIPLDGSKVEVEVPFNLDGSMSVYNLNTADNEVIAQLSDANGSFANPIELGRMTTNVSGTIKGVIPATTEEGSAYRIRVISTNYPMTSQDNGTNIVITKEQEQIPLNPQIEIALGAVTTNSVEATFTPNEDCYQYFIMIATAAEMEQYQNELSSTVEEVVKTKGMSASGGSYYVWNDLSDDTEYTVYALPLGVDGVAGVMKTANAKTDKEVAAGVAYVNVNVQVVGSEKVLVMTKPNEDTQVYHCIIIKKDEADAMDEVHLSIKLYEDENNYDADEELEFTVETDVPYYVVAGGYNSKGEWGEINKVEFVAENGGVAELDVTVKVLTETSAEYTITPNEYTTKYYAGVYTKAQYDQTSEDFLIAYMLEYSEPYTAGATFDANNIEKDTDYYVITLGFNRYDERGTVKVVPFTTKGIGFDEMSEIVSTVYPNPAKEYVKISLDNNIEELSIFTLDGKKVYSQEVNQQETIIDLTGFNSGTYIVRMVSNGEVIVERIVKN